MIKRKFFALTVLSAVLVLNGCASLFFPDFEEDEDIVVDDGGKVELRKVEETGVLVGDKANARYEDEQNDSDVEEGKDVADNTVAEDEVVPAKVVAVEKEDISAVKPNEENSKRDADRQEMRYLAGVIYFSDGGSNIDSESHAKLRKIAKTAKENNADVEVLGFASSRTRNTDPVSHKLANFKVSAQRADNTASILRQLGVKNDKITVQALSDSVPMYKEVMPEGERLNRRAEIYLTY